MVTFKVQSTYQHNSSVKVNVKKKPYKFTEKWQGVRQENNQTQDQHKCVSFSHPHTFRRALLPHLWGADGGNVSERMLKCEMRGNFMGLENPIMTVLIEEWSWDC